MRVLLSRALAPVARVSRPAPSSLAARSPHPAPRADPARRSGRPFRASPGTAASSTGAMQVHQFPCLSDNYAFLLHDPATGATAVVDTPEVAPIEAALRETGWKLTHILNTHWHADHTGGNAELKARHGCVVVGPRGERKGADAIPGMDVSVGQDDIVNIGSIEAKVLDVPGHTAGHVAYHFADNSVVFVGDTLFVMGCGRLFEGDAATMWRSIQKIMALPRDTAVYCAHEYTLANARFAVTVDPENDALRARLLETERARDAGMPTVPTTVGRELETNPFCRPASEGIRAALGMAGATDAEVFAETRRRKDAF